MEAEGGRWRRGTRPPYRCTCARPEPWCPSSGWRSTPARWGGRAGPPGPAAAERSAVYAGRASGTSPDPGRTRTWRKRAAGGKTRKKSKIPVGWSGFSSAFPPYLSRCLSSAGDGVKALRQQASSSHPLSFSWPWPWFWSQAWCTSWARISSLSAGWLSAFSTM